MVSFEQRFSKTSALSIWAAVLREKITLQVTSLNGQRTCNFIFLLEFSSGISFLDHITVITLELIPLCAFSGPSLGAHTSHFKIFIMLPYLNNLDGNSPLNFWLLGVVVVGFFNQNIMNLLKMRSGKTHSLVML